MTGVTPISGNLQLSKGYPHFSAITIRKMMLTSRNGNGRFSKRGCVIYQKHTELSAERMDYISKDSTHNPLPRNLKSRCRSHLNFQMLKQKSWMCVGWIGIVLIIIWYLWVFTFGNWSNCHCFKRVFLIFQNNLLDSMWVESQGWTGKWPIEIMFFPIENGDFP